MMKKLYCLFILLFYANSTFSATSTFGGAPDKKQSNTTTTNKNTQSVSPANSTNSSNANKQDAGTSSTVNSGASKTNTGNSTTNTGSSTTTNTGNSTTNTGNSTTNTGNSTTNTGNSTTNTGNTTNSGSTTDLSLSAATLPYGTEATLATQSKVLDIVPAAPVKGKEVVLTYLSWFLPYGSIVGCDAWRESGFAYKNYQRSNTNYPLRGLISTISNLGPIDYAMTTDGQQSINNDLDAIKKSGFDVIAFDMLPHPEPKKPATGKPSYCGLSLLDQFGQLSEKKGLKVAMFSDIKNVSADYPLGYTFDKANWLSAYEVIHDRYKNTPWYWKPRGNPAIFQFGATVGAMRNASGEHALGQWGSIITQLGLKNKKIDFFLDIRPTDVTTYSKYFTADGAIPFVFAPGAPTMFLDSLQKAINSKSPYPTWTVSPGYYNRRLSTHISSDFERIHQLYKSAIDNKAKVLLVETWNDFEEDTDIVPSHNKGDAYTFIFSYYNKWFKTDVQPSVPKSTIIVAAPTNNFDTTFSANPPWSGGTELENSAPSQYVYYWAVMNKSGWVKVGDKKILLYPGVNFGREYIGKVSSIALSSSTKPTLTDTVRIESKVSEGKVIYESGRNYQYRIMKE